MSNKDNLFRTTSQYIKKYNFIQVDENDVAQVVVVNEPALPNWMGSCHPNGSLYERPVDLSRAKEHHTDFRKILEENGIVVKTVREILAMDCDTNIVARVQLEDFANSCMTFKFGGTFEEEKNLTNREKYLLSDAYKKECLESMDTEQLVEVILTNPTMVLIKQDKDTELLVSNYSYNPLVNLVFCRDQQITTAKGVVMTAPRNPLRAREVKVMKFSLLKLGVNIVGEVKSPGTLEGGDFFPAGKDLCMVGVGMRSNMHAINYLMDNDLFGTHRVAVVKDYFDQNQQRMHLDTTSNIIGPKVILVLDTTIGPRSPQRRLVDEYSKVHGVYKLTRHDVEFSQYCKDEGYNIIPVTHDMQLRYGCNGLNLGNGVVVMVDRQTAKHVARSPHFNGRIIYLDFSMMSAMYGSVHCCSQVISRRRPGQKSHTDLLTLNTNFIHAASEGNLERMKQLLIEGANVDSADYDKRSALHLAASEGKKEVCDWLIQNGATLNPVDRWNKTPLDCAINDAKDFLKNIGSMTYEALELVRNKVSSHYVHIKEEAHAGPHQSPSRILMLAPTNVERNSETAEDNFLTLSQDEWTAAISDKGPRESRQIVLQEFADLHAIITEDCEVEVHLFTHESFENIPDAPFVADSFCVLPDKVPKVVLFPMKSNSRRREKKVDILSFLSSSYDECINLTPCEKGLLKADNTFNYLYTPYENNNNHYFLEGSCLVLDRLNRVAYCAIGKKERAHPDVLNLWEKESGYETVRLQLTNSEFADKVMFTSPILCIGTKFAVVCEAVFEQKTKEVLLKKLSDTGRKIITIAPNQAQRFAASGIVELRGRDEKLCIILSRSAHGALGQESFEILKSCADKTFVVKLDMLEKLCGGSVSGIISPLF